MKPGNRLYRLQERWSPFTSNEQATIQQWARFSADRTRSIRSRIVLPCLAGVPWLGRWAAVTGPYGARWTVLFSTV